MARELTITVYLFVFRTLFNTFKLFPQKKKTTFVASFGDNILYTVRELEKQTNDKIVILKNSQCKINFENVSDKTVLSFENTNVIDWIKSIYHLATSHKVIVDNYYGFLAVTDFRDNVQCIQLWHAAGAIKKFGLKDPSIQSRSQRAYNRFKKVYQRFNYVVVGSEKMATIFRESFGLTNNQILRTGIPRSDFFFNASEKKEAVRSVISEFPNIKEKKVILYAPTYRDDELNVSSLKLNIDKMYDQFKDEYFLLLRLHPAVKVKLINKYPNFVLDASSYYNINHLLVVTDILISDYSSIPFEFSLLNKPMIFFAYDLENYTLSRGFWEDYEKLVPGSVVKSTEELVEILKSESFNWNQIKRFADQWNQYSRGYSSKRIINAIYNTEQQKYIAIDDDA